LTKTAFRDIFHRSSCSTVAFEGHLKTRLLRIFAVSLAICCSQLWAQTSGAVLKAGGAVFINGKQAVRPVALIESDSIETLSSGVASITQPGTSVIIGANSRAAYSKDGLTLSSGSATISASAPFAAHVDRTTLKPQSAKARFAVRETPCSIQIAALEGALSINDGRHDVVLDSGKSLSLPILAATRSSTPANTGSNSASTRSAMAANCDQADTTTTQNSRTASSNDNAGDVFVWVTTSTASSILVMSLVSDHRVPVSPQAP
jgi:hypothetical protein